jgi:hypothetical protein
VVTDSEVVFLVFVKLVESGEKEKLMELLRERLVECGWRDEMKALCRFGSLSHQILVSFVMSFCLVILNSGNDSVPKPL